MCKVFLAILQILLQIEGISKDILKTYVIFELKLPLTCCEYDDQ